MAQMRHDSFNRLLDLHAEIDAIFTAHQFALLRFDFKAALSLIETYETQLQKHMLDEENILIPAYAEHAEYTGAGAPKIFLDDHVKMRDFVSLFKTQTAKLISEPHPESRVIKLLDREAFYKRLSSHHDKREREHLYPVLNKATTENQRNELLASVTTRVRVCSTSPTYRRD